MTLEEITLEAKARFKHKPFIIGVEGYGGSGKSTFAQQLSANLDSSYVINFDDFLIKEMISNADKSGFDKQRLKQQVLEPARLGKPIRYQRLLWDENKLSAPTDVPNVDYLIIEGVSCYHPSVAEYYDLKIWVETPMDVAKARGSKRDRDLGVNNDKLWEVWARTDLEYKNKYHPDETADLIYTATT